MRRDVDPLPLRDRRSRTVSSWRSACRRRARNGRSRRAARAGREEVRGALREPVYSSMPKLVVRGSRVVRERRVVSTFQKRARGCRRVAISSPVPRARRPRHGRPPSEAVRATVGPCVQQQHLSPPSPRSMPVRRASKRPRSPDGACARAGARLERVEPSRVRSSEPSSTTTSSTSSNGAAATARSSSATVRPIESGSL